MSTRLHCDLCDAVAAIAAWWRDNPSRLAAEDVANRALGDGEPVTATKEEWVVQHSEYLYGYATYPGRWRDLGAYDESMRPKPHTLESAQAHYAQVVAEGQRFVVPRGPENYRIVHRVTTVTETIVSPTKEVPDA